MLLSEARTLLQTAVLQTSSGAATDAKCDRAIQQAGEYFLLHTRVARVSATVSISADVTQYSITSLSDFRADRLLRAGVEYSDQGTWATSTAYTKNQLVQGDGDPDSKYYRCILAHTSSSSNEPGQTDASLWSPYWEKLAWKGPFQEARRVDYYTLAKHLQGDTSTGAPCEIAFDSLADSSALISGNELMYVYPVPDDPYVVRLWFYEKLLLKNASTAATEAWVIGDSGDGAHVINIPDEYVHNVISMGAGALVDMPSLSVSEQDLRWKRFQEWTMSVKRRLSDGAGVGDLDEDARLG